MGRYLDLAKSVTLPPDEPLSRERGDETNELNEISPAPATPDPEIAIARWLWANPAKKPDPDQCAACGQPVGPDVADLRVLGDGAVVCYGSLHGGLRCWQAYQAQRRAEAVAALGQSGGQMAR